MLIKICTKSSVTKSCLFLHSTQCFAAAVEMLNISSMKILLLRNRRLFYKQIMLCLCVRQIFYNILGGFHYLLVSSSYYPWVPNTMCGMLKLPNVRYCWWPIMATLIQLPFKFWFATDHTRHTVLVPKCYGQCRNRTKVTVL